MMQEGPHQLGTMRALVSESSGQITLPSLRRATPRRCLSSDLLPQPHLLLNHAWLQSASQIVGGRFS